MSGEAILAELIGRLGEATITFFILGLVVEAVVEFLKRTSVRIVKAWKKAVPDYIISMMAWAVAGGLAMLITYELEIYVTEAVFGQPPKHLWFDWLFSSLLGVGTSRLAHEALQKLQGKTME
jgi:hypothetical protein